MRTVNATVYFKGTQEVFYDHVCHLEIGRVVFEMLLHTHTQLVHPLPLGLQRCTVRLTTQSSINQYHSEWIKNKRCIHCEWEFPVQTGRSPAASTKVTEWIHGLTSTVCLAGWFSSHRRLPVSWRERITSRFSSSSDLISCERSTEEDLEVGSCVCLFVSPADVCVYSRCTPLSWPSCCCCRGSSRRRSPPPPSRWARSAPRCSATQTRAGSPSSAGAMTNVPMATTQTHNISSIITVVLVISSVVVHLKVKEKSGENYTNYRSLKILFYRLLFSFKNIKLKKNIFFFDWFYCYIYHWLDSYLKFSFCHNASFI